VFKARRVRKGFKEQERSIKALKAPREMLVPKEQPVPRECRVHKVPKVCKVLGRLTKDPRDHKALRVSRELVQSIRDRKVLKERLALPEELALRDRKARKGHREHREHRESKAFKAYREVRAPAITLLLPVRLELGLVLNLG